jgi:hypothetical protein
MLADQRSSRGNHEYLAFRKFRQPVRSQQNRYNSLSESSRRNNEGIAFDSVAYDNFLIKPRLYRVLFY